MRRSILRVQRRRHKCSPASDLRAEAERERQVDAAVQQRLGELEVGIREEVVAKMNGTAAKAAE